MRRTSAYFAALGFSLDDDDDDDDDDDGGDDDDGDDDDDDKDDEEDDIGRMTMVIMLKESNATSHLFASSSV